MLALAPVALAGAVAQPVSFRTKACCALIANESGFAVRVQVSSTDRWLPAWTADTFSFPLGTMSIQLTPALIATLSNAPSQTVLITLIEPGDTVEGTYPVALMRQASIAAGLVSVPTIPPAPVVPENAAGVVLGDTSNGLAPDAATEAINTSSAVTSSTAALASFKTTGTPAMIAAGAMKEGTINSVSPSFGASPGAGHLLVAIVTATSADPSTTQAGWSQVVSSNTGGATHLVIWIKPNSAGGDAAPTFTGGLGPGLMQAVLVEFSNVALASPTDQTAGIFQGTNATSITVAAAAVDANSADLIVVGTHWRNGSSAFTATFTDTFNNGVTATRIADNGSTSDQDHTVGFWTIAPASAKVLPLGVSPWDYDATGTSAPATGSQASVVLAASAGKKYRCALLEASKTATTTTAGTAGFQLKDGSTIVRTWAAGVAAAAGNDQIATSSGTSFPGTTGNSMTAQFAAADPSVAQAVNIGAYLR